MASCFVISCFVPVLSPITFYLCVGMTCPPVFSAFAEGGWTSKVGFPAASLSTEVSGRTEGADGTGWTPDEVPDDACGCFGNDTATAAFVLVFSLAVFVAAGFFFSFGSSDLGAFLLVPETFIIFPVN